MNIEKTYSIGEASELVGFSSRQLRSWEGRYIPEPMRIKIGERMYRRYTADDIRLLESIKERLDEGYALPAAAVKARLLTKRK